MTKPHDNRILNPGWAGELAPDEFAKLQEELYRDPRLAFKWGFKPSTKRRSELAIRRVACRGDPDRRAANVELARRQKG